MKLILTIALSVLVLAACKNPHGPEAGPAKTSRTISAQVGPLLIEAKALGEAGNYEGALAKVNDAEAVKSTPDDAYVINQMKQYFEVKSSQPSHAQSGGVSSAAEAKAKFANDYNAGRFKDVIADGELLRKFNALDVQSQLVIGQAYFKAGDLAGCAKYIQENFGASPSEDVSELLERCKYLAPY